jgi:hypothetical protein
MQLITASGRKRRNSSQKSGSFVLSPRISSMPESSRSGVEPRWNREADYASKVSFKLDCVSPKTSFIKTGINLLKYCLTLRKRPHRGKNSIT